MVGCQRPTPAAVETVHAPSQRLVAIDTLMQSRPDSALTLLLDSTFNDPYYQLLLSEALYKNYYDQINRSELLDAMGYFDSINDSFLSARCHYMNGVGYYEIDSVVPACAEYMKALEIMEERFSEKELVGYKAKFMALINTHLCHLFSDKYLHGQAIYFGKKTMCYYNKYEAEPWHVAWTLEQIGMQYAMMDKIDSASFYYNKGMKVLSDTNLLVYRDILSQLVIISINNTDSHEVALQTMNNLMNQAENEKEYLSRCLIIGDLFYHEKQFDSASYYLTKVFAKTSDIELKKQAAEWLWEINKTNNGDTELLECASFLLPFANQEENQSAIKAHLVDLFNSFRITENEIQHQTRVKRNNKRAIVVVCFLIITILISLIIHLKRKYRLIAQMEAESYAHEMKQKALSGRLKKSNEALRNALINTKNQINVNEKFENYYIPIHGNYETFLQTQICIEIVRLVKDLYSDKRKTIKTNSNILDYKDFALSAIQLTSLSKSVETYFPGLNSFLKTLYADLDRNEWLHCCLYLMQLDKMSICVLLQEPYYSCRRYTLKLEKEFGCKYGLTNFLLELVNKD